jgi:hypothetical protein
MAKLCSKLYYLYALNFYSIGLVPITKSRSLMADQLTLTILFIYFFQDTVFCQMRRALDLIHYIVKVSMSSYFFLRHRYSEKDVSVRPWQAFSAQSSVFLV